MASPVMSGGLPATEATTEGCWPPHGEQTMAAKCSTAPQPRRPPIAMFNEKMQSKRRSRSQEALTHNNSHSRHVRSSSAQSARRNPILAITDDGGPSLLDVKGDMMVKWIYEELLRRQYASGVDPFEGVVLKKARNNFACYPPELSASPSGLFAMVVQMNVRAAMTVNTLVVRAILAGMLSRGLDYVPLPDGLRVQIIPTVADLPRCQLHQFAAFVEELQILVIWDDEPLNLLGRAQELERRFIETIWTGRIQPAHDGQEHKAAAVRQPEDADAVDLEEGLLEEPREVILLSSLLVSVMVVCCLTCLGYGWRNLARQIAIDGDCTRLALLLISPIFIFLSMFFFQATVTTVFQLVGPISAVNKNSKYYSGKAPRRLQRTNRGLPHVTFQMPVYKEGLDAVIRPTVMSVKASISTYEMQGGTANIFVNDDGMQLISEEEAQERREFYEEHNIGWVARPKHNPKPQGGETAFLRRGKFKKASNMNYALHVSNRVEEKLQPVSRGPGWTQDAEQKAYEKCLAGVVHEDDGRTWADGNIRIGDYILLIDSDTRVPEDCLLDAVSEMEQSPQIALIQFSSGVMQVTGSFFENGVTWFTNLIYTAITYVAALGDACAFVGHNAMLRWSAIQVSASYTDEDGYEKFWSESHVSEDFDMALRLQMSGYALRYVSYMGDGFKEGVSLTVYDELARWEKYAYGCNELLFHPLRHWPRRGPFTKLFREFFWSGAVALPKKITICSYIGTYYALAGVWLGTLTNYFVTGWYKSILDHFYMDSFALYVTIVAVFTGLSNLSLAVYRFRRKEKGLLPAYFENLKWVPMFAVFLGGISLHVSQAILSHFFEVDMAWGATAKEVDDVPFGVEVMRILRRFRYTFLICLAATALMLAGAFAFPEEDDRRITAFYTVYPLAITVICHFALPLLLNPALMRFTW